MTPILTAELAPFETNQVEVDNIEPTIKPFSFSLNKKEVTAAFNLLKKAIPARATHPILNCVVVRVNPENGQIELTTFDLATQIRALVPATFDIFAEFREFCVEFKLFSDLVSALEIAEINIRVESNKLVLTKPTKTGRGKASQYDVPTVDIKEFPKVDVPVGINTIPINAECLDLLIKATSFTAKEITKQVLCGVHCITGNEGLIIHAVDGHRLFAATSELAQQVEESKTKFTIPSNAIEIVAALKDLTLTISGELVTFANSQVCVISRLIEGAFPEINRLTSTVESNVLATFDKSELIKSLDTVKLFSGEKLPKIIFEFAKTDECSLLPYKPISNANEQIEVTYIVNNPEKATNKLILDYNYIKSCLAAIDENLYSSLLPLQTFWLRYPALIARGRGMPLQIQT